MKGESDDQGERGSDLRFRATKRTKRGPECIRGLSYLHLPQGGLVASGERAADICVHAQRIGLEGRQVPALDVLAAPAAQAVTARPSARHHVVGKFSFSGARGQTLSSSSRSRSSSSSSSRSSSSSSSSSQHVGLTAAAALNTPPSSGVCGWHWIRMALDS